MVITVICERKIAGTHGLSENGKADALLCVEELLEERRSLVRGEFLREKPGGRVGERGAKSGDFLGFRGVVDGNRQVWDARRSEAQGWLLLPRFTPLHGGCVRIH